MWWRLDDPCYDALYTFMNLKIGSLLFFILFLNVFIFRSWGSVAQTVSSLGFLAFLWGAYFQPREKSRQLTVVGVGAASVVALGMAAAFRGSPFVQFVLSWATTGIVGLVWYLLLTGHLTFASLMEVLCSAPLLAWAYFLGVLRSIGVVALVRKALTVLRGESKKADSKFKLQKVTSSPLFSLGIGVVLGLPIVSVILALLISADPIFYSTLKNLFGEDFFYRLMVRAWLSFMFLIVSAPILATRLNITFVNPLTKLYRFDLVNIGLGIISMVAIVMATFLIIQWPYVFARVAAETDLSKYGVATYSEYVTKGFSELLVVASLLYGLLWAGLTALRSRGIEKWSLLKGVQLLVMSEFGIFWLSILRRVWLYQHYHGLSLIRAYGSWFLIVVGVLGITLLLRHFSKQRWIMVELGVVLFSSILLGVINVEHVIATYDPPTVNGRVDYVYLSRLSSDGVAGWLKSLQHSKEVLGDSRWSNSTNIDEEGRRQIAYTGVMLAQQLERYDQLQRRFASEDEQKAFYLELMKYSQEELQTALTVAEERVKITSSASTTVNDVNWQVTSLKSQLTQLNDAKTKLEKGEIHPADINLSFPSRYGSLTDFTTSVSRCKTLGACQRSGSTYPHSFYSLYSYKGEKPNWLDSVFTWNAQDRDAYAQLKEVVSASEFIALQKTCFALHERVSLQPDGERSYQRDISLESPLLDMR
jgi:hypothetical protein